MTGKLRSLFFYGRVLAVATMRGATFPIKYISQQADLAIQVGLLKFANLLFRPGFDPKNQLTIEQNYTNAGLEDFFTLLRKTGLHPDWFRGKRLLDIGCGHGRYSIAAAECGAVSVDGIDINEPRIRFAQQKASELQMPHVRFHVASVYELPFDDESFDGAFSHTVFEHLPDLPGALHEIYRVLKPGAYLFVTHDAYRSRYGAHVQDLVHMPWPALFFSEGAIERFWKARAEDLIRSTGADGNLLSFDDGLGGLNKLRISEVEEIMRASKFTLVRVAPYAQEEQLLKWFPFLRKQREMFEYLRGSAAFLLRK